MKILTVHPGASWATADVFLGMVPALRRLGVECIPYQLDSRIEVSKTALDVAWKADGEDESNRPTHGDVLYHAGMWVIERALRHRVDAVLVFSGMFLHPDTILLTRRAGVPVGMLLTESPYEEDAELRLLSWVDVAWTNERSCLEQYREVNPNTFYLPHAYDPDRHRPGPVDMSVAQHDVVFVGTPFPERVAMLRAIDWTGIDLGLYGFWDETIKKHEPLYQSIRGQVIPNEQAVQLYRRAKIGLNIYRVERGWGDDAPRIEHAESINPRTLELAATGCFQLNSYRDEIHEVFGDSVETFRDATELEQQIRFYLQAPSMRHAMAIRAQRAVQPHTFDQRARQIVEQMVAALKPEPYFIQAAPDDAEPIEPQ